MGLFTSRKTVFVDSDILVVGGGFGGCGAAYEAGRSPISSISACCMGATSGRPRKARASSGVQSTSIVIFMPESPQFDCG